MNKEAAGDDLGLTLQTGFVTKALVGLFGSDKFRLAVSADGASFFDGLIVDNTNGIVDQPRLPRFKAYTNFDNYVPLETWTKIGLNNTDYNDQGAFDAANNRFVAPVDGTYLFGAIAALQGQRQHHGPHERAAGAERHHRNQGRLGRDLRHPRLARDHDLAADHGAARRRATPSSCRGTSASRTATSPPITPASGAARSAERQREDPMTPPHPDAVRKGSTRGTAPVLRHSEHPKRVSSAKCIH